MPTQSREAANGSPLTLGVAVLGSSEGGPTSLVAAGPRAVTDVHKKLVLSEFFRPNDEEHRIHS